MTVQELKEELKKFPDNMNVFMYVDSGLITYVPAASLYIKKIFHYKDPNNGEGNSSGEICLIIDEE